MVKWTQFHTALDEPWQWNKHQSFGFVFALYHYEEKTVGAASNLQLSGWAKLNFFICFSLAALLFNHYYSLIDTKRKKKAGNNAKKVQYQLLSKTRFQHNDEMFHMKWVTNFSTFTLLWTWALDVNMCAASTQLLVISCLKIMGKIEGCHKHYADVYL